MEGTEDATFDGICDGENVGLIIAVELSSENEVPTDISTNVPCFDASV